MTAIDWVDEESAYAILDALATVGWGPSDG